MVFPAKRRIAGRHSIIWRRHVACAFHEDEIGFNQAEASAAAP
jgi:hypothetical protein